MDDVVAVGLITGASGVGGSVLAFFAARRAADRQASTERERFKVELEKLRLEQQEPHYQHRQVVYHDLLNWVTQWHKAITMQGISTIPERTRWLQECDKHINGASLFGSRPAFEAVKLVSDAVEVGMKAGSNFAGSQQEADFTAAFRATVEAMRKDTSPDG